MADGIALITKEVGLSCVRCCIFEGIQSKIFKHLKVGPRFNPEAGEAETFTFPSWSRLPNEIFLVQSSAGAKRGKIITR